MLAAATGPAAASRGGRSYGPSCGEARASQSRGGRSYGPSCGEARASRSHRPSGDGSLLAAQASSSSAEHGRGASSSVGGCPGPGHSGRGERTGDVGASRSHGPGGTGSSHMPSSKR